MTMSMHAKRKKVFSEDGRLDEQQQQLLWGSASERGVTLQWSISSNGLFTSGLVNLCVDKQTVVGYDGWQKAGSPQRHGGDIQSACLRWRNDRWHFNGICKNVSAMGDIVTSTPILPYFRFNTWGFKDLWNNASGKTNKGEIVWNWNFLGTIRPAEVPLSNTPRAILFIWYITDIF